MSEGLAMALSVVIVEVPVLAASLGPDPDNQSLVAAFSKLSASLGLVLVDWKSQFILLGTGPDGKVEAWQPQ
jgi:hypothetical protein